MKYKIAFILFLLFFALIYYINHTFFLANIVSNSMNNTLEKGDYIVYTLTSKNNEKLKNNDIVLFKHNGETLIKRCVGIPKDTIRIVNDSLFVNSRIEIEESILKRIKKMNGYNIDYDEKRQKNFPNFIVPFIGFKITLNKNNLRLYQFLIESNEGVRIAEVGDGYFINKIQVKNYIFKKNYYFVLGDNRFYSSDSRHFGPISQEDIFGKLIIIL